jgi:hypothetical protein
MDKKIIFFDIDGTIYNFNTGIPADTREAIRQLKENGHIPVICTGRTRCMIYPEHLEAGFTHIVAGAGTYVEINQKQCYLEELESSEARRVIDGFIKYGFLPVAEGRDNIYLGTDYSNITEHNREFLQVYYDKIPNHILSIEEPEIKVSKVSAAFTTKSDMQGMIDEFKKDYTIVNHNNHLLELIPNGYNKAKGIEKMITEMDIPWENTYAFGDSYNDIDMLEYVKYGCAMGNSENEIKKRVPYVTEEFDKGGIYNALKKFELI